MIGGIARRVRPFEFQTLELILMRLFFAVLVWRELGERVSETSQRYPLGLARWFDLTFLGDPEVTRWLMPLVGVCLLFYVVGRGVAVALPVVAVVFAMFGALKNSQAAGAPVHDLQIIGLVLLGQSIYYVGRAVRGLVWGKPDDGGGRPSRRLAVHRGAAWVALQVVVATYLVTAVTKVVRSEGEWIKDAKYFPVQIEKAQRSEYYNRLEPIYEPGSLDEKASKALTSVFANSPGFCRVFLAAGLLLEFGAVLAVLGRGWSLAVGVGLITFHLTVMWLMQITFMTHIAALVIFLVNAPYWAGRLTAGKRLPNGPAET